MTTAVGSVATVLRYPVKSMRGEEALDGHVNATGLAGDRTHAVVDAASGRVGSAKDPRRWRALLGASAEATPHGVRIRLAGGERMEVGDPGLDAALSRELGRPVRLEGRRPAGATLDRAVPEEVLDAGPDAEVELAALEIGMGSPGASWVDFAPLHLITTGTLEQIAALSPQGTVEAARYRPNVVIATAEEGWVENAWVGRVLEVGDEVVLRVVLPTPRCALPSLAQGELPADPHAVRVPFAHNRLVALEPPATGCAGVYAEVLHPGRIAPGAAVRLRA